MTVKDLIKIKGNVEDLIRLGSDNDGGYVINNTALIKSDILYTYGVGDNYDFEKHYINIFENKLVRMYDPTIGVLNVPYNNISFYSDGLYGISENNTSFEKHILSNADSNKSIFLKIDTEGAEYDFFNYINLNDLINVVGMVVEFHELYDRNKLQNFKSIISKLSNNYDITHVHGNNFTALMEINGDFKFPSTPEITFLRKDLNQSTNFVQREFPLADLDQPNAMDRKDHSFTIYE
jgi:hypothetical protein